MTTFRISYYNDRAAWQLLESGRRIRFVANKQEAKALAKRRAKPGDKIVTERRDGSKMSAREVTARQRGSGFLGVF